MKHAYTHVFLFILLPLLSCNKESLPKTGIDGITPMPEAIDIGTVVNGKNIKWASFNLGASNEYEIGDKYAWGETFTKEKYTYDNYSFANHYSSGKVTKYCPYGDWRRWGGDSRMTGDGLTTLLPSDDVASVKLGGKWRMPTLDEIKSLVDLQTDPDYIFESYEHWTIPEQPVDSWGSDIGMRITRKSTGTTLLLPRGQFWSSSLEVDFPLGAYYLDVMDFGLDQSALYWNRTYREFGMYIRPVTE